MEKASGTVPRDEGKICNFMGQEAEKEKKAGESSSMETYRRLALSLSLSPHPSLLYENLRFVDTAFLLNQNLSPAPDMEDDIRLLLDCLHFQHHSPSSQCQALTTLATMCAHSSKKQTNYYFYDGTHFYRVSGTCSFIHNLVS